jgi:hypothetical protein
VAQWRQHYSWRRLLSLEFQKWVKSSRAGCPIFTAEVLQEADGIAAAPRTAVRAMMRHSFSEEQSIREDRLIEEFPTLRFLATVRTYVASKGNIKVRT